MVVGDVDETIEAEPNDTPESATPLAIPVAVSGRLGVAGDVDFYRVEAKKGERISVRSRSFLLAWITSSRSGSTPHNGRRSETLTLLQSRG